MTRRATILAFVCAASSAGADPQRIADAVAALDRAPVVFDGSIRADRGPLRFVFLTVDGTTYRTRIDAGRVARERVEDRCADPCRVSGAGTIEIDGAEIVVSVTSLTWLD